MNLYILEELEGIRCPLAPPAKRRAIGPAFYSSKTIRSASSIFAIVREESRERALLVERSVLIQRDDDHGLQARQKVSCTTTKISR